MLNNEENSILKEIPYQRELVHSSQLRIDPLETCYFTYLSRKQWRYAKILAARATELSKNVCTYRFGAVGKVGTLILHKFLQESYDLPWTSHYKPTKEIPISSYDFTINNINIVVKTRSLKTPEHKFNLYDRTIHLNKFPMMISETEITKDQHIYVCCGYRVTSREGYILGWTTYDKILNNPVNTSLKYPARCIPIGDLYQLPYMIDYIKARGY